MCSSGATVHEFFVAPDTPPPDPTPCDHCQADVSARWLLGEWRAQPICGMCIEAQRASAQRDSLRDTVTSSIESAGYPRLAIARAKDSRRPVLPCLSSIRYADPDAPSWAHIASPMGSDALEHVIAWHARVIARAHRAGVRIPSAWCVSEHRLFLTRRTSDIGAAIDAAAEDVDILIVTEAGRARATEWVISEWSAITAHRASEGLPTVTIGPMPLDDIHAPHYMGAARDAMRYAMRGTRTYTHLEDDHDQS